MSDPMKTWHLCPTFDIGPPPKGRLVLGSIVAGKFKLRAPLNPAENISIPSHLPVQTSTLDSTEHTVKNNHNVKLSLLANIAQIAGLGPSAGVSNAVTTNASYTFKKEITTWFEPDMSFISWATASSGVQDYLRVGDGKKPVYMITGLKVVEGAAMTTAKSKSCGRDLGLAADFTAIGAPVGVEARVEGSKGFEETHSFGGSTPFVFCVRLKKIWWDRKRNIREADELKGAFLDSNGKQADQDIVPLTSDDTADDFDDQAMAAMVSQNGEDWTCVHTEI